MPGSLPEAADAVAQVNVKRAVEQIRNDSSILAEMEQTGSIAIVGAMYDVKTGKVEFAKA